MKNTIRGILICALVILAIPGKANAQVSDSSARKNLHTFNFYLINGYALSYDFCKADKFYLRAELDLTIAKSDIDDEGKSASGNMTIDNSTTEGNRTSEYFSVSFSPQIIFPVYTTEFGQAYLGGGPSLSYSTRKSLSEHQQNSESGIASSSSSSNNEKNYDAGVLVIGGVKAFITGSISLFAEVHLSGGIKWNKNEWNYKSYYNNQVQQITNSSEEGNGWFYDAKFIRLGVSLSL